MKTRRMQLCLSTMMLAPVTVLLAQAPDTLWTKTYGGSRVEQLRGVVVMSDGGFLAGGYAPHDSISGPDFWWFKVDDSGNLLWERRAGYADLDEVAYALEPALDGGYFLGGEAETEDGFTDMYIVKLDSAGVGVWGFTFGKYQEYSEALGLVAAEGGGALAVGTQTINRAGSNLFILETFPSGLYKWSDLINWGWTDQAYGVDRTSDGGYIVTGTTNSFGEHSMGLFLQKLDAAGLQGGFTLYTQGGDQWGNCVKQTSDGGYIAVGSCITTGEYDKDMFILKADSTGNVTWVKFYGADDIDEAAYVEEVPGGYIVTGTGRSSSPFAQSRDVYALRLDLSGDTLWTKYVGDPTMNESSFQIRRTADGGYIIAGLRTVGSGNADAYLVRLAPDPFTGVREGERLIPEQFALYQNFPNPFNPATEIRYDVSGSKGQGLGTSEIKLAVYDLLGREIAVLVSEHKSPGSHQARFDGSGLASGVYLYRMSIGSFVETRKMLLLR